MYTCKLLQKSMFLTLKNIISFQTVWIIVEKIECSIWRWKHILLSSFSQINILSSVVSRTVDLQLAISNSSTIIS